MHKKRLRNFVTKHRRVTMLLCCFVLTLVFDVVLIHYGSTNFTTSKGTTDFKVLPEPSYFYVQMNTTGPSYFFPIADVKVSFSNPYADAIGTFDIKMSLDNSTWVDVPFSTVPKSVDLGTTEMNSAYIRVYERVYSPPQPLLNQTLDVRTVENSFLGNLNVHTLYTPETDILIFLLSIALFSFILQILDFSFKEKKENGVKYQY